MDQDGPAGRRGLLLWLALASTGLPAVAAVREPPRRRDILAPPSRPPSPEGDAAVHSGLSVEEIVRRNVTARGGLEAWRRVQTLSWTGTLRSGSTKGGSPPPLPFKMELSRPNRSRFEVQGMQVRFTRIFDGTQGWKVRPGRSGPEVQDFGPDEVKFHQDEFVMDGLLIDHAARGVAVVLEGINELESGKAYRLGVRLPSGASRRLWIDAETFLDVRCDRPSWNPMFRGQAVSTYFRDYRAVDGLQVATRIESGPAVENAVEPPPRDALLIEQVLINPALSEHAFARPKAMRSHGALVQIPPTSGGAPGPLPSRPPQ